MNEIENFKVVAVVVNWNGYRDTITCVNSLLNGTYPCKVVIVDNFSSDESVNEFKKINEWTGKVDIIESKVNGGCSAGNNLGIEYAIKMNAEFVLFNNNDAFMQPDALEKMMETINSNDKIGLVAPLIMYYGTKTVWCAGCDLNKTIFKAKMLGMGKNENDFSKVQAINYAVGAVMLARTKAIIDAGRFDEELFYYYEETEWQFDMKKKGYLFYLNPIAKVYHKVGSSSGGGRTPTSTYYLIRNRGYFIKKKAPTYLKPIAYLSLFLETGARSIISIKENTKISKMAWVGLFDFLKGIKGKNPN